MEIIYRKISDLKKLENNPRTITEEQLEKLKESIQHNPDYFEARPLILSNRTGELTIIAGNQRYDACVKLGIKKVPTALLEGLTEEREKEIIIRDNLNNGEWDVSKLLDWDCDKLMEWGLGDVNFGDMDTLLADTSNPMAGGKQSDSIPTATLQERFIFPPFSVLDTRVGNWINRRRMWLSLGIKSEIGREKDITYNRSAQPPHVYEIRNKIRETTGNDPSWEEVFKYCEENKIPLLGCTSIFDPVLCELMYRWFNVPEGLILDPFAGGSVRGIVAAKLGMSYIGVDLRKEQVEANRENAKEVLGEIPNFPVWKCGDSTGIDKHCKGYKADMIFSCPPYADLEVYSDDPKDLSTMNYPEFIKAYETIIAKSCSLLKDNSFAIFVVGEVRDKSGFYHNFVSDTITAFEKAGLHFYNELILVNQIAGLAIRVSKPFNVSRKTGKHHQNVLVFYKGDDPKNIRERFSPIDFTDEDIDVVLRREIEE